MKYRAPQHQPTCIDDKSLALFLLVKCIFLAHVLLPSCSLFLNSISFILKTFKSENWMLLKRHFLKFFKNILLINQFSNILPLFNFKFIRKTIQSGCFYLPSKEQKILFHLCSINWNFPWYTSNVKKESASCDIRLIYSNTRWFTITPETSSKNLLISFHSNISRG